MSIARDYTAKFDIQKLYSSKNDYINYSVDENGFRSSTCWNKPEDIDILVLGGSTTQQIYIDDKNTWVSQLEKKLKKNHFGNNFANAGQDGQSSFGILSNFEIWFPTVKNLNPRYFMIMLGSNDIFSLKKNVVLENKSNYLKRNSVIYNLFRKLKALLNYRKLSLVGHNRTDFNVLNYTNKTLLEHNNFKFNNPKHNLHKLKLYADTYNSKLIFISQPSLLYKYEKGNLLGLENEFNNDEFIFNGLDYYELEKKLYSIINDFCSSNNHYFIDINKLNGFDKNDFYDLLHFNVTGSAKISNSIYKELIKIL